MKRRIQNIGVFYEKQLTPFGVTYLLAAVSFFQALVPSFPFSIFAAQSVFIPFSFRKSEYP